MLQLRRLVLIVLFLFASATFAQVDIKLGEGQLEILDSEWPLSDSLKTEIETQLLVDPELKDLVALKPPIQIVISEGYLGQLEDQVESSKRNIEANLKRQVLQAWKAKNYSTAKSDDKTETKGVVIESHEDNDRVIMGSEAVISKIEMLKDLVVVGGKVEMHGTVESLVVVGGYVILFPDARVNKELVIIGGYVEERDGSTVNGKRVDMSMPGGDESWTILSEKVKSGFSEEIKQLSWLQYLAFALKLVSLMLLAWLGYFLAPRYQADVEQFLARHRFKALFAGLLTTLLVLPVTLFLTLSIVGIPLLPLQFSLLFLFVIYGEIHIAKRFMSYLPVFKNSPYWSLFFGLLIIEAFGLVSGLSLIKWVLIIWGFGAASNVFYSRIFRRAQSG